MSKLTTALTALLIALACSPALAQNYPVKPIRMIIPWPPGGGTDGTGRVIAQGLSEALHQQVVVENRGGASGRIGTELAARAAPDGYTIVMGTVAPNAILPASGARLAYDTVKDFAPIALVATSDYVLVVHPSVPAKSVKELVALAKSRPGQIEFASAGNGSMAQMAAELFKVVGGVDMLHVPYKGGGPAVQAVVSGEVSVYFGSGPSVVPFTSTGRLRALGTSGRKRSRTFPDLPRIAESLPGHEAVQWFGLMAPAGTPQDIIARLHAVTAKVVARPDVQKRLIAIGSDPEVSTPEELAKHIQAEIAKWRKVIQAGKISLE